MDQPGKKSRQEALNTFFALAITAYATLFLFSHCRRDQQFEAQPAPGSIEVVDDLRQKLILNVAATRIASLSPSNTEILYALGCGLRIVLRDTVSNFPAEVKSLPATNPFVLSAEHLLGFSPDLVLLSAADLNRIQALQHLGLPVASFSPQTFADVFDNIRSIGKLCGAEKQASNLIHSLQQRMNRIRQITKNSKRPTVFVVTDSSDPLKPWTAGAGSFVDHSLQLAGAKNIAAKIKKPYAPINVEEIFLTPPDIILLMNLTSSAQKGAAVVSQRLLERWSMFPSIKNARLIDYIPADLLSRPGPRLIDGLEMLAQAIHPEAFKP